MNQPEQALAITLDDGRTIIALPRPEDQDYLTQAARQARISLGSSEFDTQAHSISNELTVDVEGHAMTLRLPTAADAATLRKALIAGALTATVVAAGAIASMQNPTTTQSAPGNADLAPQAPTELRAPVVAPAVPAPRVDVDMLREQRVAESEAVPWTGSGAGPSAADTRETGSGPLEFDR